MLKQDILVVAKTYPVISSKYTETVCTAGIIAKTKKFVRLYPIRFRYLEGAKQFKKYQWIKASIDKALVDSRPESYTINMDSIEVGDVLDTSQNWDERYSWIINKHTMYRSVEALKATQEKDGTSLGIIKPNKVKQVVIQKSSREEIDAAIARKNNIVNQLDMFETKKDLYVLPIKIMIEFSCTDPLCEGHKLSILDWEFGQLYRKVASRSDWENKIESKIMDEIFSKKRDTFMILGNMAAHPQNFCVLGFFWPPKAKFRQIGLFS